MLIMAIRSIPLHMNKISWMGWRHSISTYSNIAIANPPGTGPTLGIALMDQFACAEVDRLSKRSGWYWFYDVNPPYLPSEEAGTIGLDIANDSAYISAKKGITIRLSFFQTYGFWT